MIEPSAGLGRRPNKGEYHAKVSSKYVGVSFNKSNGRWTAYTGGGCGLKVHGYFLSEKEAARVRNRKMIELYGYDPRPNVIEGSDGSVTSYSVTGDAEFIIRAISHIRLKGGGNLYINKLSGESEFSLRAKLKPLMPLLHAQSYISDIQVALNVSGDVHLNECQDTPVGPWLSVPDVKKSIKAVLHRTFTPKAPDYEVWVKWRNIGYRFRDDCAFIGTRQGLQFMRTQTRMLIPRLLHPYNLLHAAQFIAGAEVFVGNKNVMFAIAEGLGVAVALEGTKEFDQLADPNCRASQFFLP